MPFVEVSREVKRCCFFTSRCGHATSAACNYTHYPSCLIASRFVCLSLPSSSLFLLSPFPLPPEQPRAHYALYILPKRFIFILFLCGHMDVFIHHKISIGNVTFSEIVYTILIRSKKEEEPTYQRRKKNLHL